MLKGGLKIKFDLSSIVDNLSNEEVEDLKNKLNYVGYSTNQDINELKTVVEIFVDDNNLENINNKEDLWKELINFGYKLGDRILSFNTKELYGSDVEELQELLSRMGFYSEPINGIYSNSVVEAVTRFQENRGLTIDGVVGLNTVYEIRNLVRPGQEISLNEAIKSISPNLTTGTIGFNVCFDVPNFKVNPADVFIYDHLTHFTKETLENLLHNIGFEILKIIEHKDQVPMMVICKKTTSIRQLENFYSLTNNLLFDSLSFNQELFSIYDSINNSSKNFGVIGLGAFIWKGIQMNIIDISKIFSFYDENLTLINSKVNGITINSLNKIPHSNSFPLIFSVSPCYIDKLKEKLFRHKNNLLIPKSYLYFEKYFN